MQFADLFLTSWFLFSLSLAWLRDYRHTLYANIALCLSFAVYAFLLDKHVATAIPLIAALTSVVQLMMPISDAKKFVWSRNLAAIASAVIAFAVLYEEPVDIFPCLGFTAIRIGEAQQSARKMKIGYTVGISFWMIFGIFEELYLLVFYELIIIAIFLYKFRQSRKSRTRRAFPRR